MPKRSLPGQGPQKTSIKAKSRKSSLKNIKGRDEVSSSSVIDSNNSKSNSSKEQSLSSIQQGACDNVSDRYEKLGRRLGHGTYGIVYQAKDLQTGQLVALKRCIPHHEASDGFPITTLREIQSLRICRGHPHIVQLENVAVSRSGVFLVFEYCEHDLSNVIDTHFTRYCKSPFVEPQIKTLTIHLLKALAFLHSRHMIHRDIKLSNLLYTDQGFLKLADFGLSRPYADAFQSQLTPQVASLWYRPPELLLGGTTYTTSIDMWGVACIMGELFTGEPLMRGQTELEQIMEIVDCVGLPDPDLVSSSPLIRSGKVRLPQKSRRTLLDVLGDRLSRSGLQLVHNLLKYNPKERWTAAESLRSSYLVDELPLATPTARMPRFPPSFRN